MKKQLAPRDGSVVSVPLPNHQYAYVYHENMGLWSWLYDFVTDHPIESKELFGQAHWKYSLSTYSFPPGSEVCARMPELCDKIPRPFAYYILLAPDHRKYHADKPYWINPGAGSNYMGGAQDIINIPRKYIARDERLIPLIMSFLPELEVIPSTPNITIRPKQLKEELEETERILSIEFPPECDGLLLRKNEIEDTLDEALTEADVGEIMGTGSGSDGAFDLAAAVDPRRIKTALRIIRKVLKEFNAPSNIRILEDHPEHSAPIEHPFVPGS